MNLKQSVLTLVVISLATIVSLTTLGPVIGRGFIPSIHQLDTQMGDEAGKLIVVTVLIQAVLLITVIKKGKSALKAILLGIAAGFLLVIPTALKDLDTILYQALTTRSYAIVDQETNTNKLLPIRILIVGTRKMQIPKEISDLLYQKYPPKSS